MKAVWEVESRDFIFLRAREMPMAVIRERERGDDGMAMVGGPEDCSVVF